MPPPLLFDLSAVDLDQVVLSKEQIYERLPHRYEFMLLDGVCHYDAEAFQIVAFSEVTPDAWWCRGHVPGRPLLPGVLMLEMAAQASAVAARLHGGYDDFIGFGGVEDCKFRGTIVPPTRLYLMAQGVDYRTRRIKSVSQGVVDGTLVFEATTIGLTMP